MWGLYLYLLFLSFMKTLTHNLRKLCLFVFFFAFLFSNALPANAALSEETKAQLREILADSDTGTGLLEIMTFLYTQMYTSTPGTQTGGTKATPGSTTNIQICTHTKNITKSLSLQTNDVQVKTLQKILNTLASKDAGYKAVSTSGDGSLGNETTYYGNGTAAAVTKLQERLGLTKTGTYDTTTNNKVKSVYCGTPATPPVKSPTNENTTPTATTNTQDTYTPPTDTVTGTEPYVSVTSPVLQAYAHNNVVTTENGKVKITGTAENTDGIVITISDDLSYSRNPRDAHIQTCHMTIRAGTPWTCTTHSDVTTSRIKVEIWNETTNAGELIKGDLIYSFTARVETPDVPSTSVSTYDENGRVISNGDMTVNLTSPGYGTYKPGDTFSVAGTGSGMFYVSFDAVGKGWKSGYGTSIPSKGWNQTWTLPSTIKDGDIDVKFYGAKTAADHVAGNKVYIGEFSVEVKK